MSINTTNETELPLIENYDTESLIEFFKKMNLKLDEDDFALLRKRKINGQSFLLMDEEKLERCGLEMGPTLILAELIKSVKNDKKCLFSLYSGLKEVLKRYNIDDNCLDILRKNKELKHRLSLTMNEQKINTTSISLSSISTQTMNVSDDQKSLTYLIQGLISRSLAHFPIDEKTKRILFIGGKTEGVCKISSVDSRLSSVSLYCEYELGNTCFNRPLSRFPGGYPIVLKSSFSIIGVIITALNQSQTQFVDNINYVIELVEMFKRENFIKSNINVSNSSTGKTVEQTSKTLRIRTVMTQTEPFIEDKKSLTYIAKGIMFKSISWFVWGEDEAFKFGKKEGILRLVSSDPKLKSITLTCNYKLSNALCSFQGDIGYPMIVSCSYGSVNTALTQDKKMIMDNFNYILTFLS